MNDRNSGIIPAIDLINDHFYKAASEMTNKKPNEAIRLRRRTYDQILEDILKQKNNHPIIVVFSSSRALEDYPQFMKESKELGRYLAHTNAIYTYGNGNAGIMGSTAQAFIDERDKIGNYKHHIIGITLQRFADIEQNLEGSLVFVGPDFDLRERLMIDVADAFICLKGGFGTQSESQKYLMQNAYEDKRNRPFIVLNTKYDDPDFGEIGAFDFWLKDMQCTANLGTSNAQYMECIFAADTPLDAVKIAIEEVPGLKWHDGYGHDNNYNARRITPPAPTA